MSETKTKNKPFAFPRETIIGMKEFKEYHPDILFALLPKPNYTKEEATKIINDYFKKK